MIKYYCFKGELKMNKRNKIMVWFLLLVMVLSVVAGFLVYLI
ncbi:MAG: DUF4044 domain-containing protein [Firmicutes bacterium]|nr:DUF4044 domain-containing protein [Bacillota bacterium]